MPKATKSKPTVFFPGETPELWEPIARGYGDEFKLEKTKFRCDVCTDEDGEKKLFTFGRIAAHEQSAKHQSNLEAHEHPLTLNWKAWAAFCPELLTRLPAVEDLKEQNGLGIPSAYNAPTIREARREYAARGKKFPSGKEWIVEHHREERKRQGLPPLDWLEKGQLYPPELGMDDETVFFDWA